MASALHLRRRRMTNRIAWGFAALALALVLVPVVSVVGGIVVRAVPHWQWKRVDHRHPRNRVEGSGTQS